MKTKRFEFRIDDLFYFNKSETVNPQGYDIHLHDSYELLYFLTGDATYHIEGQTYQLYPHDIIFTNTRELHKTIFHSNQEYRRIFIQFKPMFLSGLQTNNYNIVSFLEQRRLGYHNKIDAKDVLKHGIDSYLNKIYEHALADTPGDNIMVRTLAVQMLVTLNTIFSNNTHQAITFSKPEKSMEPILEYINQNLADRITLDLLEEMFFINKYHLCHVFKQSTGFSVLEYITYKRMVKAKELLLKGMPAMEVATSVGYGDYSNFYRVFRKIVGTSPSRYVKR